MQFVGDGPRIAAIQRRLGIKEGRMFNPKKKLDPSQVQDARGNDPWTRLWNTPIRRQSNRYDMGIGDNGVYEDSDSRAWKPRRR